MKYYKVSFKIEELNIYHRPNVYSENHKRIRNQAESMSREPVMYSWLMQVSERYKL